MPNYFNYFTEIETRFHARRGSILLLSTLDWALIETWREAGLPLEAVLRGIDDAFDKYDARLHRACGRLRKVNGLAWCAQSVIQATEAMRDAVIGSGAGTKESHESGFEENRIAAYIAANATTLDNATLHGASDDTVKSIAARLREVALEVEKKAAGSTEQIEAILTALETRMFAALMLNASEETLVSLREQASRELAPHRGKMTTSQIKQVTDQFLHKRLLEQSALPRLSLYYMSLA